MNQSYSDCRLLPHYKTLCLFLLSLKEFLLQLILEYLSSRETIVITLQYHFAYPCKTDSSFEWSERRKISSINQSTSIILFIINSFLYRVSESPRRAYGPISMDWSLVRSMLSFTHYSHSQALLNDIYRMLWVQSLTLQEKADWIGRMIHVLFQRFLGSQLT